MSKEYRLTALASACAALLLAGCGGGGGGSGATTPPVTTPPVTTPADGSLAENIAYSGAATASLATAAERAATVKGTLALNGATIAYTATTGHLTGTDSRTGRAASFFYVAYTRDGQDLGKRPVTFFYNGGPGSASMWLHLGSFAPKRIVTQIPSSVVASPVQLVDNAESLIDASDLVFVDAVGTGYSQAVAPATNQDYWGVDTDAAGFRDFVQRYVAVNGRQASPKVLFGESYGAPRTAVLANLLETAGVRVDGVVLHSAIMDYNANCGVLEAAISCEGYIPTYAATSNYYKLASPAPFDFNDFMRELRGFSATGYRSAAQAFLSPARTPPPQTVVTKLVSYTGIPALTWQQDLNYTPGSYARNLLPGQLLGRYDARVSGAVNGPLAVDGDPSLTVVNNPFITTMRSYLAGTLKYSALTNYLNFNDIIGRWNFRHDGKELPDTIPDLAAAITLNPAMKVLAQSGYHDLATPFYQTELDMARLGANPNIQVRNYHSGHMIYLDDAARSAQRADLVSFYGGITAGK
ncbi:S10 family peptidase [Pseudoduganella namucuonensis]|uniref:S10 family peptidase n=1 Tax=Pseudoduganella namucuonensis TaxID=1035707 RepID=UPI000B88EC37